jgi:integrase
MVKINLDSVYAVKSKGKEYLYAWRGKGAPRLYEKPGSKAFIAELQAIQEKFNAPTKGTLRALVCAYRSSSDFQGLSSRTKSIWNGWLKTIEGDLGYIRLGLFENPQIRQVVLKWRNNWSETPRSADYALQVLSRVLSFACQNGELRQNPIREIKRLYQSTGSRAEIIWEPHHLDALEQVASKEIFQAVKLATLTGLRQSDLLQLKWSSVLENRLEWATGKSKGRTLARVPMYDELKMLLDTIPKRAETILTTTRGQPWGVGFGSSFNKAKIAAGIDLHFHDTRGTFATVLYKVGLESKDIAMVMGWKASHVEKILERYVSKGAAFEAIVSHGVV